ncbi:MAG: signal peptidase II [Clostridia bacterium]|nr:signal peptidase II [Clostridia bacterium]MBN2882541.1 signal peptidase II [Clostridia bacterium]
MWFLVTIFGLLADRVTKAVISGNLAEGEKIEVIENFFYITHHTNTGAAWGILQNATMILGILSVVVSIGLLYFFFKFDMWPARLSLTMIIGGAIGNAIGRIFNGRVIDFLDFYIFGYDFPIFNVADMMVTVGTIILVVFILFFYKEPKEEIPGAAKDGELSDDNKN